MHGYASFIRYISVLMMALVVSTTRAGVVDTQDPCHLLETITTEVLSELKAHQTEFKQNPAALKAMMDRIMMPHVDVAGMAQWALGRQIWSAASDSQKDAFIAQFKQLMINTYSSALSAFHEQTIEYFPIRGGVDHKERVQVVSRIEQPGQDPLNVVYRLVKKVDGWKVYDIIIEGVSLLKGFQAQFSEDTQNKTLDQITADLARHNQQVTQGGTQGS